MPDPNPTAEQVEKKKDDGILELGIQPNQLDKFDMPTYHFRLYMMSDKAVVNKEFGPTSREHRIVIAESGVTAMGIDNVEIKTVTGPSKGAGIGISTNFSFQLHQPFGATLLDEIVNAAELLGVQNFAKCPYFLELSFRTQGNDQGALSDDASADSDFRNLIWVWPLVMTKMSIDVNSGGSIYNVDATLYGDMAYTNHIADLDKSVNIEAETVGEFFVQFAAILNLRELEKTEEPGYKFPDTFSFKIDKDLMNERIVPDSKEERQNRAGTFERVDGKMVISFQAPVNIDQVVQNVLSLTEYFQNRAKGTDDKDAAKKDGGGEEAIFQTIYRVVADSEMGSYDAVRQDYQRHNKYLIIPYEMTTLQTQSNEAANVTDQQRFDALRRRGLVTKVYDYIYTGLNDQVLDFELIFNFNWYAALPLQGGLYNNPGVKERGVGAAKTDTEKNIEQGVVNPAEAANALAEKIKAEFGSSLATFSGWSLEDFLKSLVPQQVTDLQEQAETRINAVQLQISDVVGTVQDGIETVQAGIPSIPEVIPGLPTLPAVPGVPDPNSILNNQIGGALGDLNQTIASVDSTLARLQSLTKNTRVDTAAEGKDVDKAQQELRSIDYKLEDQVAGERDVAIYKTTYIESTPGKSQGGTGSNASSPGQNMLSALFEQANSPVSADLLNIDLKIKGDPYWLEPQPIGLQAAPITRFERALADRNGDGSTTSFNGVNSTDSQTYFVFRSFTPQQFDAETGITPKNNRDRNALNGIYGVRTVTHTFSQGQFTQELNAIRDPKLNLRGINLDAAPAAASDAPDTFIMNTDGDASIVDLDIGASFQELARTSNPDIGIGTIENTTGGFDLTGGMGSGPGRVEGDDNG